MTDRSGMANNLFLRSSEAPEPKAEGVYNAGGRVRNHTTISSSHQIRSQASGLKGAEGKPVRATPPA